MKGIASFLSGLFVPIIVPIYALLLVMFLPLKASSFISLNSIYLYSFTAKMVFLSLFVVFVVLGPTISFLVLKKNKSIQSIHIEAQEERKTPLMIIVFYYLILTGFLYYQSNQIVIPPLLIGLAFGGGLATLTAYFISKKLKICLHSMAMGGFTGFFYMYMLVSDVFPMNLLYGLIILSGIIATARIFLHKQTLFQVGAGYFIGFAMQIMAIYALALLSVVQNLSIH